MQDISRFYQSGDIYDWEYLGYNPDIGFLSQLCRELATPGGRVLNLCCGTLREGIELAHVGAKEGFTITGVDITESMLAHGRAKLTGESESIQRTLRIVLGDMRTVDVGIGEYDFAFVPFNSFAHMLTLDDQLAAMRNIHRHLKPGGYMLLDMFLPDVAKLALSSGPAVVDEEQFKESAERGGVLVRNTTRKYDPATQTLHIHFHYLVYELGGERRLKRQWWSPLEMRLFFPGEWELLHQSSGFTVTQRWGSYEMTPFNGNSGRMLFLARK